MSMFITKQQLFTTLLLLAVCAGSFLSLAHIAQAFTDQQTITTISGLINDSNTLHRKVAKKATTIHTVTNRAKKPAPKSTTTGYKSILTGISTGPTATPAPTAVPTVTQTSSAPSTITTQDATASIDQTGNLITNAGFEDLSGGVATGWNYSNHAGVTVDTNGHGLSSASSMHFQSSEGGEGFLFSTPIAVDADASYTWKQYTQVMVNSNYLMYVDEYDANGNWISGKNIAKVTSAASGVQSFSYTPSSSDVKYASLQYQTFGGVSDFYLDAVFLGK